MNFDHWRHHARGILMQWLGRSEQAIAAYQDAYQAEPGHAECARAIAWLHAQAKRWRDSESWYERALESEPEHADTWFNLGYAREQGGRLVEAEQALARAKALNPNHDRAWYGLGMVRAHLGDHAAAAEALTEAARLQPMNGVAWYALGMAHHHCNRPDKVEEVIDHVLSHDPQTAKRLIQDAQRSDLAHLVADL
jgi:tetratricopeptide (TPR) repeat protein